MNYEINIDNRAEQVLNAYFIILNGCHGHNDSTSVRCLSKVCNISQNNYIDMNEIQ